MKSTAFRIFAALALSAFVVVPAPLSAESSRRVNVELIEDLKLSGFNDDADGELQWRLEADSASVDPRTKSEDIKRALWNLKNLRLRTYAEKGQEFAVMTSGSGQFHPENREAESDARVDVRGETFVVRGNGWSWSGRGHENLIRVHDNVFVSIRLPKDENEANDATEPEKDERLTVRAKRLTIEGLKNQTTLTFSGEVEVFYDDIFMKAESLEVVIAAGGNRATDFGNSEKSGGLESVRQITGRGSVSVKRGAMELTGDVAEFLPQTKKFFVRGNAQLEDSAAKLSVRGDKAVGEIKRNFIEILSKETLDGMQPEEPVVVEMPSVVQRGKAANTDARAKVSGNRMTVASGDENNVISLFGNVCFVDREIRIDADKLVVTADASDDNAFLNTSSDGNDDLGKVHTAVAEGNVRANYSGRELFCERADVLPQEKRITLSGEPRVVSAEENSSLSGDRVEIFLDQDLIEVYSAAGEDPSRRRVEVTLPSFSEISKSSGRKFLESDAEKNETRIVGDRLNLTRGKDLSTFDIFGDVDLRSGTIVGNCDRLVVYADSRSLDRDHSRQKSDLSQIKKIIADGDVFLKQNGYELSGGQATITPSVTLKEWTQDEIENATDGKNPFLVVVGPDRDTGTRPRIIFPGDVAGTRLELALPSGSTKSEKVESVENSDTESDDLPLTKKKTQEPIPDPESAIPAKKTYLESDAMELIAGESRARFFLRGDVILVTEGGANGMCDSVEGLLLPQAGADSGRFDAEKVICRGNVRLAHEGSTGRGEVLEIFPPKNRAILSGTPKFREKGGIELHPGNDRFIFDLENRQLITEAPESSDSAVPAQVSRPKIIIPKGSDRVFIIPKSVRRKDD